MERGRGKVEKFSTIPWESAVQQLKKGWLLEFPALEGPSPPFERSAQHEAASLFRTAQSEAGCIVGKGPGSGGDRPGFEECFLG